MTADEARRRALGEGSREEAERQPGVYDVLDEDHVAPSEWTVEVLQEPDASPTLPAAVGRQLDDVELVVAGEGPREVGEEHGARLQRRDEQREPTGVRALPISRPSSATLVAICARSR